MARPTTQEMLEKVELAIMARLNGGAVQSYSIGGRNLQYMQLPELEKMRDKLIRQSNPSGGTTTYASFGRPS